MSTPARLLVVAALAAVPQASYAQGKLWTERSPGSGPTLQLPDFSALAEQLVPAVVSIQVEQKVAAEPSGGRGRRPNPHEFFFPFDAPREFDRKGLGSGFFISKEGLILTNYHVVEKADTIEVTYATKDGSEKTLTAKVLGTAPEWDVALIQTNEAANAPVAMLGDSEAIKIGEWVMAIGNPFGLSHTVSVGIISAKERRDIAPSGRAGLYDFLQTDAAINPGNSGGPLINTRGEVIGINSAINAAGSGIGFAIPINMVKSMLPDLKQKGKYSRGWIGIRIQGLSPELAQSFNLPSPSGALVSEVVQNGPAAEAGLKEGDVILEFDGKPVRNSTDLPLYAGMAGVGRKVALKVWRGGKSSNVSLKLAEYPSEEEKVAQARPDEGTGLGLVVADITPALQRELELEHATGVAVKSVDPGSPAAKAGLVAGDVILAIAGHPVNRARDLKQAIDKLGPGELIPLQVMRGGSRRFVALKKPAK